MAQMNGPQAKQAQIDTWQDRHEVHAYKSVPMQEQTDRALNRDHAEALEMNANDDSGRAAFLGTMSRPASRSENSLPSVDQLTAGAAFLALGEAIMHAGLKAPEGVDLYTYCVSRDELLTVADHYEAKIKIRSNTAWVEVQLGTKADNGVAIRYTFFGADCGEQAILLYEAHNVECLVPAGQHGQSDD